MIKVMLDILNYNNKEIDNTIKRPQIMGILNITDDSMGSRMLGKIDVMLETIDDMIKHKVDIIDVGAAALKQTVDPMPTEIELARLKEPVKAICDAGFINQVRFSIDSYNYEVSKYCIEHGFKFMNDISGLKDDRKLEMFKDYLGNDSGARIVYMFNRYTLGLKTGMIKSKKAANNFINYINNYFEDGVNKLVKAGIKNEQIVLDVGYNIGHGATEHSCINNNLDKIKKFGCELLIPGSLKTLNYHIKARHGIDSDESKLGYTLALHTLALNNGGDIIRCHHYREHVAIADFWYYLKTSEVINKI